MAGKNYQILGYMTGTLAIVLSLYYLLHGQSDLTIFAASFFLLLICITDTLKGKIPNLATIGIIFVALGYHSYWNGITGLSFCLLGLLTGFLLLFIPYLMGGTGAGDVKALAGLGALLGPVTIIQVFFYTALIGGILGTLYYLFNFGFKKQCRRLGNTVLTFVYTHRISTLKSSEKKPSLRFPYAAAIAFGYYTYVTFGGLV